MGIRIRREAASSLAEAAPSSKEHSRRLRPASDRDFDNVSGLERHAVQSIFVIDVGDDRRLLAGDSEESP